jgi:hypothetical protein
MAALAIGLVLNMYLLGGKNFVGLPFPIVQWPIPHPPRPDLPSIDSGLELSMAGLLIDLLVWATIALVVHKLASRLPRSRSQTTSQPSE